MAETFHLRCDRDDLIDALHEVLPGWQAVPVVHALDRLVAANADTSERPRLHRGASEAQQMTVEELAGSISKKRIKALGLVARHPEGITCDSLEASYELAHSSISARLNWLERHGLVWRDKSDKRETRAGGWANPYRATEAGRNLLMRSGAMA